MPFPGDLCPKVSKRGASHFDQQSAIHTFRESTQARLSEKLVNRRNLPQEIRLIGRKDAFALRCHGDISTHQPGKENAPALGNRSAWIKPKTELALSTGQQAQKYGAASAASNVRTVDGLRHAHLA